MSLAKLKALHAHIEDARVIMPERLNSWMEDGKLLPANTRLGANQIVIGRLHYDAVFELEAFTGNPALLMALVCAWLTDNDDTRDDDKLPPPDIDVDLLDDDRAMVEIRIRFRENIEMISDASGQISMGGQQWALTAANVFDASTVGVGDDQLDPTDLPYTRED